MRGPDPRISIGGPLSEISRATPTLVITGSGPVISSGMSQTGCPTSAMPAKPRTSSGKQRQCCRDQLDEFGVLARRSDLDARMFLGELRQVNFAFAETASSAS